MKKAEKESVIMATHIHTFLTVYAPSIKNQSEHTVRSHGTALSLFLGYLESEHGISPATLNANCFCREMIEGWLYWLQGMRGCSTQTCNVRLSSLKAFLHYLGGRDLTLLHIGQMASTIPRMKTVKSRVEGMSKNSVKALMAAPDTSTPTGRRDLALIVTIYATAARLDEVLSMKVRQLHLDRERPHATVIGKGSKIRTLFLLPKAVTHLKRHLREHHGGSPQPEAYVFYSRNGGMFSKISQAAISKRLKLHAKSAHAQCADVPIGLHAHQLRHARASHWLEDGMNVVQISLLLGHEQLETTMAYLDISIEQKSLALERFEDGYAADIPKKWRSSEKSLPAFCGVSPLKK
jgi:site-specific recombinase XerD